MPSIVTRPVMDNIASVTRRSWRSVVGSRHWLKQARRLIISGMGGCSLCRCGLGNPYSTLCSTTLLLVQPPCGISVFGEGIEATKRVDLIAEFAATQHAFFAETEKPRQVMRGFPLIQLASHAPPVCFVIECLQNVHRFVNAPDLGQPLIYAVSTGIGAKPVEDE